jgi:aspartyl-tRNA(Asn)/glutamyl-tRNA(Gln) amidotransferase subunit A
MPLAPSLDTIGILARSARDIAMLWPVVSEAPQTLVPEQITLIVLRDAIATSAPQIAEAANAAFAVFAGLGFAVFDRTGFPDDADHHALTIMQAEAAHAHRDIIDDNRIDATLRKRLRKGLSITGTELAAARSARDALRAMFVAQYLPGAAAVVVMPIMPIVTPSIRETDPSAPEFSAKTLYAMSRFTRFANYLGLPACALPAGFDNRGLPIALQLIGAPGAEGMLLTIASRFQAGTNWHGRVPAGIMTDIACEQELAA